LLLPGRALQGSGEPPAPFQLVWGARQRNKQFVRLAARLSLLET
jgi:hypothetical protein